MVSPRSIGSFVIISALLLAACKDNGQPQPTADTAAAATTGKQAANTTASSDAAESPQAKATAEASADTTATPEGEDGDKTADNKAGTATNAGNTGTDKPDDPDGKPKEEPVAAASASASAAPEEEPAGKTFGKKQVESMYAAWLQSAGRYTVGKASSVQAVVVAKGEYKCNDNYPYKFKLNAAPAGVSFPSNISRSVSKGKARSVVSVPFTPTSAGQKTISGTFYFSVCNDSTCKIAKKPLSVTVTVHEES